MSFADLVASADRAVQFHLGSVLVTYTPELADPIIDPVDVLGMFDAQFVLLDEGHAGVEQRGPAVFVRLEDLPDDPMTTSPTLTIDGTDYQVVGRRPDGMGGILFVLHLVD